MVLIPDRGKSRFEICLLVLSVHSVSGFHNTMISKGWSQWHVHGDLGDTHSLETPQKFISRIQGGRSEPAAAAVVFFSILPAKRRSSAAGPRSWCPEAATPTPLE